MRKAMIVALCLSLCACGGKITAYSASADVVGSADSAYVAAENVGKVAVQDHRLDLATFHDLAAKAHYALVALRDARTAGTQPGIDSATKLFNDSIDALNKYKVN